MIYALARAVEFSLRARKFPLRVVYGPEHLSHAGFEPGIVIERDRAAGDSWAPVQGAKTNPRRVAVRVVGAKATVWARSSLPGASIQEHEDVCDQIVDALYVAINDYMHSTAKVATFPVTESRYLSASELDGLESWPGVAYVLRWAMPRGVSAVDYSGHGLPEGSVTASTGEIHVRRNATDPPEIVELP